MPPRRNIISNNSNIDSNNNTYSPPKVEIFLSRSAYRCGDTVCGTVRLFLQDEDSTNGNNNDNVNNHNTHHEDEISSSTSSSTIRKTFTSASVHLAGRCKLDHRWHPSANHKSEMENFYGKHHPLLTELPRRTLEAIQNSDGFEGSVAHAASLSSSGAGGGGSKISSTTICFFATNCVDLLGMEERAELPPREKMRYSTKTPSLVNGSGGGVLNGRNNTMHASSDSEDSSGAGAADNNDYNNVEGRAVAIDGNDNSKKEERNGGSVGACLAFTFRVELPPDLPHSISATCCRYFYSAVVSASLATGEVITAQVPFSVLSCARMGLNTEFQPGQQQSSGRVKFGLCTATAHRSSSSSSSESLYSCYVSPSTLSRRHQIGVSSTGLCSTMTARDTRSVRVTNANGTPTCILNLVGTQVMIPGGRALLQFTFQHSMLQQQHERLRCYQICACLHGTELACFNSTTRVKTKTFIFDTRHSYVEEDTDSISMGLTLPLDCPCTISTDLLDISIFCKIELTVAKQTPDGASGKYEVLRLDLPCQVVHTKVYRDEDEMCSPGGVAGGGDLQSEYSRRFGHAGEDNDEDLSPDVLNDLTMLSIRMMEEEEGNHI